MRPYELIKKKRDGGELTAAEIHGLIDAYVAGDFPDYQMAALLMAIFFRGMSKAETAELTLAMANSGDRVDLSAISGIKVDKHSTGGVADTTTLVLGPLVAALGVPVAKMSGRGLGHTGGTIDKLEAIPGFRTSLSSAEFAATVNRVGLAVIGQSGNLCPADKRLYALRDVTATIEAVPLIASSIMSKKIAGGSDAIVLDVKCGTGAFMKDPAAAAELGRAMVDIGVAAGRETVAVVSDMNQPLGRAIGNALEVREAINTLRGQGSPRLVELCLTLAGVMVALAGKAASPEIGRDLAHAALADGRALARFRSWVAAQGGDPAVVEREDLLPLAPVTFAVKASSGGFVTGIDTEGLGRAAMGLGAGRARKEDRIDLGVGLVMHVDLGQRVAAGEVLAQVYGRSETQAEIAGRAVGAAIVVGPEPVVAHPLVYEVIRTA